MILYIVKQNSDTVEGKGHMRPIGYFSADELDKAVEFVQGKGVMGVGPGEVWEAEMLEDPPSLSEKRIYGYRRNHAGVGGYGFIDLRDDVTPQDPEYNEYRRLKRKFEGK